MSDYIDLNGEAQSFGDTAAQREVRENDRNYVFHSWSAQGQINPLPIAKGEGVRFWDYDGNEYLDFSSQLVNLNLGHQHPGLVKAIQDQAGRLATIQPALANDVRGELARLIAEVAPEGLEKVFFTNGGAEAVEMALKLARIATGKKWYISTVNGFHGKSMGAVSVGGKGTYREPYAPMVQHVQHVEYGNAEDARKAIRNLQAAGESVAAMIVEPIQGEAGVIVPPPGYLKALREICDEYGVVLIFDEIQTGMARTGTIWRCEAEGVTPDILTYGKAFGGGVMPITGIICRPHLWTQQLVDNPWLLGSPTFGGNPVCAAAALATIKYMLDNDIAGECRRKGELMKNGLNEILAKYPDLVSDVRGTGLMLAIEFVKTEVGYAVAKGLFSRGVMTAGTLVNAKSIRIQPPAVISEEQIATVLEHMDAALMDVRTKGY